MKLPPGFSINKIVAKEPKPTKDFISFEDWRKRVDRIAESEGYVRNGLVFGVSLWREKYDAGKTPEMAWKEM